VISFVCHNEVACFLLQAQRIQAESIARSHSTTLEEKLSELALERQRLQVGNTLAWPLIICKVVIRLRAIRGP
jgi:hypothetical protein